MESTWTQVDNVQDLQQQGISMTKLMWRERNRKRNLQNTNKNLRNALQEAQDSILDVESCKNRTQDVLDVTMGNYSNLIKTILALSTKNDGTPLNNEMTQVVNLVLNSCENQKTSIENLKQLHLQRLEKEYAKKKQQKDNK